MTVIGAWASVICTSDDIGKLIGSDGSVYATADVVPEGVTVSCMIAYINTSENWGLVIGPVDLNFNGTEGSGKSDISQAMAACNSYDRALPAATTSGWRLPTKDDFDKMIGSDGCLSADNLRQLKGRQGTSCVYNDKGVYGMLTDEGYWSSTATQDNPDVYYNLWSGDCTSISNKTNQKYVRPCFTINIVVVDCTPDDIGKILGSDGSVYATAGDMPNGVTASGMIAYINGVGNWGLVIGPTDLNKKGDEGSGTANLWDAEDACNKYGRARPAAAISSWRLPSRGDYLKMIGAFGCQSDKNLRQLKGRQSSPCTNSGANIQGFQAKRDYWTSTQDPGNVNGAYYFWNDVNDRDFKDRAKCIRPCFTINVKKSETLVSVKYFDAASNQMKTALDVTPITNETTQIGHDDSDVVKWYCVSGDVTLENRVKVTNKVAIILEDGCLLKAKAGIKVNRNTSLSIYAQSVGDNCGKLEASYGKPQSYYGNDAAIGGDGTEYFIGENTIAGTISIYGGDITASSIGGGVNHYYEPGGKGGTITFAGGRIYVSEYVGGGYNDKRTDSNTDSDIHLSWSNYTDRYYVKRFNGSSSSRNIITLDKDFTDGTKHYDATGDFDARQINDKFITPDGTLYNVIIGGPTPACLMADGVHQLPTEDVTLTAINGYTVSSVVVTKATNDENVSVTDNGDGTWSFIMPECNVNVTPTVTGTRNHFVVSHDNYVRISDSGDDLMVQGDVITYGPGQTITFAVLPPAETYELQSVKVCKMSDESVVVTLTDKGDGYYSFTMPEYDVFITPAWGVTCYGISRPADVTIEPSAGGTEIIHEHTYYKEGATIYVTVTPPTGKGVSGFYIINDDNGKEIPYTHQDPNTYEFTMPAADVTLSVSYGIDVAQLNLLSGTDDFIVTSGTVASDYNVYHQGESDLSEGPTKLLDGKYSALNSNNYSKWCAQNFSKFNSSKPCFVEFKTNAPVIPVYYVLITGNDNATNHERNPKSWTIQAKANPKDAWTTIATVTDDNTLQDENYTAYTFDFNNPENNAAYQYFRFEVTANQGAWVMQLSEMQMWVKKTETLTATEHDGNYWTTYYNGVTTYELTDNENAFAYTATVDGNTVKLHKLGKVIPANTATIIVGKDENISMISSNKAAEYTVSNDLKGTDASIQNPPANAYVLDNGSSGLGFYEAATIEANTAYLTVDGASEFMDIEGLSITLADNGDNSTTISEYDNTLVRVTLSNRKLYRDGYWNTLCLPFSLNSLAGTQLEGATVKTLEHTAFDSANGTLTLNFSKDLNSIEAGVPYIVKWVATANNQSTPTYIESPVFNNVIIEDKAANVTTDYVNFIGDYSRFDIAEEDKSILFLGAENTLYYPNAAMSINACRAHFKLKGLKADDLAGGVRSFVLNYFDGEDEQTGSQGVTTPLALRRGAGGEAWYSLDGRRLEGKPSQRGIYVNNGRKVVIK